jgi:hypothetical protein
MDGREIDAVAIIIELVAVSESAPHGITTLCPSGKCTSTR